MDVTRMTRLAHWKLYTLAENYPEYRVLWLFHTRVKSLPSGSLKKASRRGSSLSQSSSVNFGFEEIRNRWEKGKAVSV